ncbi:BET1-like protein [Acropora cervicornis]|uniref:BET1-like protein n=1 Tax=Acropora cervicornis TaxID=6130 RepID=A0AAD9QRZ2_ACRCE|nr:BET1-like protein [Acropora millepora]KAK2566322.1 BET1-like protein [Acropora cervicornis]
MNLSSGQQLLNKHKSKMATRGSRSTSTDEMLETENNRMVNDLAAKVSRLKGIAIDIENESKQQNNYLDGMGDEFGSSSSLLSGSAARLSKMINSGRSNRKVMCYLIAGLVGLFIVGYYALSKVIIK